MRRRGRRGGAGGRVPRGPAGQACHDGGDVRRRGPSGRGRAGLRRVGTDREGWIMEVRLRRVYEPVSDDDGTRILADRVWPRGLSTDKAPLDGWETDAAPSTEPRTWSGPAPAKFEGSARRYEAELEEPERAAVLERLRDSAGRGTLTLLTATRDVEHSQAAVLADRLRDGG